MRFRPFVEAKEFAQSLGLKSESEWKTIFCKSGNRPPDIPANPNRIYKQD
jgi:hypothetical protein